MIEQISDNWKGEERGQLGRRKLENFLGTLGFWVHSDRFIVLLQKHFSYGIIALEN